MPKSTLKKSNSKTNTSTFKKLIKVTRKKSQVENNTSKKISNDTNHVEINKSLEKYVPLLNKNRVYPKVWELPNRKHFYNWITDTFKQYEETNTINTKTRKAIQDP